MGASHESVDFGPDFNGWIGPIEHQSNEFRRDFTGEEIQLLI